nr:MAG TPA: hypothetical protein [Caudoviricetes sp.]
MLSPGRFGVRAFPLSPAYRFSYARIELRALGGTRGSFLSNSDISLFIVVQE